MIPRKFPRAVLVAFLAGVLGLASLADNSAPSVDKLTEQLASHDLTVRRDAAYQLSNLGPAAKPALPALLKALDDEDKQVWFFAIGAIAAIGPEAQDAIPVLIERAAGRKGGGHRERDIRQGGLRAAYALSRIGAAAIPPLIEALGDKDVILRTVASRALGQMGPLAKDAVPALIKNLGDPQDTLRDESTDALSQIGPDAGPALVAALQDADPHRRAGAANALARLDPPFRSAANEVEQAAQKEKDATALAALFTALPRTGVSPDRSVTIILPAVTGDDETLRHAALNALLETRALRQAAVPKLAASLKDAKPAAREYAARALGRIGPGAADALPALVEATRASGGAPAFAGALAEIGPKALPPLLAILQNGKPEEGKWVLEALRSFGPPGVPYLTETLKDKRPEVRASAAVALGEMGHDAAPATGVLFALTKDAEPAPQAAAFRALVAMHADIGRLKPLLEDALNSKSADVRRSAAAGLAAVGGAASLGVAGLTELLSDDNPAGRLAAVQALGQFGDKAAPAVQPMLARLDDPALQSFILEAFSRIGPAAAPAVPRLLDVANKGDQRTTILPVLTNLGPGASAALPMIYAALTDRSQDVRASAATALAAVETNNAKALQALVPLLKQSESGKVRRMTAHALPKYGPAAKDAVPALIGMLDKDTERGEAMRALKAIGVHNVPDLLVMLSVPDPKVRTFACESLGTLGPDARDAASKLHEIADEDGTVRASATAALKKIEPPPPATAPAPAPAK